MMAAIGLVLTPIYLLSMCRRVFFGPRIPALASVEDMHPRELVKRALEHNAAALIVAHNHPSGDSRPSLSDEALTKQLKDALEMVDVRLLDHMVIGDGEWVSMADWGMV